MTTVTDDRKLQKTSGPWLEIGLASKNELPSSTNRNWFYSQVLISALAPNHCCCFLWSFLLLLWFLFIRHSECRQPNPNPTARCWRHHLSNRSAMSGSTKTIQAAQNSHCEMDCLKMQAGKKNKLQITNAWNHPQSNRLSLFHASFLEPLSLFLHFPRSLGLRGGRWLERWKSQVRPLHFVETVCKKHLRNVLKFWIFVFVRTLSQTRSGGNHTVQLTSDLSLGHTKPSLDWKRSV